MDICGISKTLNQKVYQTGTIFDNNQYREPFCYDFLCYADLEYNHAISTKNNNASSAPVASPAIRAVLFLFFISDYLFFFVLLFIVIFINVPPHAYGNEQNEET